MLGTDLNLPLINTDATIRLRSYFYEFELPKRIVENVQVDRDASADLHKTRRNAYVSDHGSKHPILTKFLKKNRRTSKLVCDAGVGVKVEQAFKASPTTTTRLVGCLSESPNHMSNLWIDGAIDLGISRCL